MELSIEIKEARRKLGLTQERAAEEWGIPLPTLRHWEQGDRTPRGLALAKLKEIIAAADRPAAPVSSASRSSNAPSAPPSSKPKTKRPRDTR